MPEFGGFVGPAYESRSRYQDAQRSINLYPEIDPTPGSKATLALMPTPGTLEFLDLPTLATLSAAPVRLLYTPPSRPELGIACMGNTLITFVPSGAGYSMTQFTLSSNVSPMVADDNGTDILVSDGDNLYSVNIATLAVARLEDSAVSGGYPAVLDGYFALNRPGTPQFYTSGLRALTFDALDFATKEAESDDLVRPWSQSRELWLLGEQSTEVWYNAGGQDFPFARNNGAFMQHGLAATHSLSRLGETFAFVATDERGAASVVVANGYGLQKISTTALDYEMSTYETVADAIGFSYRASGHEFYQLTFPTANKTWVYDITCNMWHQRASLDAEGNLNRHRANCFMHYRGKWLIGDYQDGKIYELRDDVYSDNGDKIPRIRRCPHIIDDRKPVRYQELQVEFEPAASLGHEVTQLASWESQGVDALYKFETGYHDSVTGNEAIVFGVDVSRVTNPVKFDSYSAKFTAYNSYLYRNTPNNSGDLPVPSNTEDFTLNGWVYVETSVTGNEHFFFGYDDVATGEMAVAFRLDANNDLYLCYRDGNTPVTRTMLLLVDTLVPVDQWVHLEVDRSGNTMYGFVNGVLCNTGAVADGILNMTGSAKRFTMGASAAAGDVTNPYYLDEIRLNVGEAEHTADFIPDSFPTTQATSVVGGFVAGDTPRAMLRWSDDGGSTWSNEHWVSIGKTGEYKNRARWTRMGAARDRVYEVRVSDPVKVVIIGATLNTRTGA